MSCCPRLPIWAERKASTFLYLARSLKTRQSFLTIWDKGFLLAVRHRESLMTDWEWTRRYRPSALPVCLQIRKGVIFHRPTQGWTVEEANLLCQVSIYSPTVQPWVGRWSHTEYPPLEAEWSLPMRCLLFILRLVGLALPRPSNHFPSLKMTSRNHCLE